ncbi:hexose transporter-like protein [Hyaloscypha bicolor E]|uniref:Hexose transporter-like protein n=1 Tax=Hyaloscypha bicolor E TaxID=1095630 RepID=A0A2J6TMU2_9HELO|nr:hexose transporter-like protein [Hyaloscypha bicolor E]PMD64344.1 hexose transporter-like protein [Hyaloscypha bicolor E]
MVHEGLSDPILTHLAEQDRTPWYKKPNLRKMYFFLFLCAMGVEMTSGFDSTLMGTLQFSPTWNKYFDTSGYKDPKTKKLALEPGLLGLVNSCYQLGSLIGIPFVPWYSQLFGRRWSVMTGSLIMVVGAILQGFAQNLGMYIFARMALGFGIVMCIVSASALIGELGHPNDRATLTSFFNASYFLGAIAAAAIAIATSDMKTDWSWRLPSLLQMCPSLLQICFIFFVPESPRWLVSKDRYDDALELLIKYHGEGDRDSVLVQAEMAQIQSTIKIELEHAKQSWMDMLRTSGMRRRVIIASFLGFFTQMSGNTLISYYQSTLFNMMGYTTNYAKTRINVANNCWGLLTASCAAIAVGRFPRRAMFMTSAATMFLMFLGFTVAMEKLAEASNETPSRVNKPAAHAALFFYFAFTPCYNIGNNAITYTYLTELFPFAQRARGIAIEQVWGKISGFFTQNVNSIAITHIGWKYMAIITAWLVFEFSFIYFMYPETAGRTLEELAFLFEDKEYADQAIIAVEKRIHHEGMAPAEIPDGKTVVQEHEVARDQKFA